MRHLYVVSLFMYGLGCLCFYSWSQPSAASVLTSSQIVISGRILDPTWSGHPLGPWEKQSGLKDTPMQGCQRMSWLASNHQAVADVCVRSIKSPYEKDQASRSSFWKEVTWSYP